MLVNIKKVCLGKKKKKDSYVEKKQISKNRKICSEYRPNVKYSTYGRIPVCKN